MTANVVVTVIEGPSLAVHLYSPPRDTLLLGFDTWKQGLRRLRDRVRKGKAV